jgi:UPF0755 protein
MFDFESKDESKNAREFSHCLIFFTNFRVMTVFQRIARIFLWTFIAACALALAFGGYGAYRLTRPAYIASAQEFYVGPKTSLSGAITQLEQRGVVEPSFVNRLFARAVARWTGRAAQRGVYEIRPGMLAYETILQLFSKRALQSVTVTFQEGVPLRKYAEIASEKIGCSKSEFLRIAYSDSLKQARGITSATIEGYLMPNTYEFYRKTPADEILDKLLDAQDEFWASVASTATHTLDRRQALVLASIVEAETPVDDEKPRVAGVYWNRYQIGMKLEADPTVQYIYDLKNPSRQSRRLLYRDLEIDSPYNTYRYAGLPPAPINSPGAAAIRAALAPERHNYYYFVAKLDGTNTHTFTRTAAEHEQAVAIFRARRRAAQVKM